MSKSNTAAYIAEAPRELAKIQRKAKFFASQHRKYRAQKSDLAQPYKTMTTNALSQVRFLKRIIQKVEAIQKRHDQLTLRIAELEATRSERSSHR